MSSRSSLRALTVLVLIVLAAACGGPAGGAAPRGGASSSLEAAVERARSSPYTWMITLQALRLLAGAGLPRPLLQAYFDHPSTILLGAGSHADPLVPRASLAVSFTNDTSLVQALDQNRVPAQVRYVVLDVESWPLTPPDQRRDPVSAARYALVAARAAGKQLVFSPGTDLVWPLVRHRLTPEQLTAEYDHLLAGPGAQVSSVFEVQAQFSEGTPAATSFAAAALAAARQAHPGARVLIGLSTNPNGRRVSPADLLQVVHSVPSASGFWLNVPGAGRFCPHCGKPQPQVAVSFLEQLAGMRSS